MLAKKAKKKYNEFAEFFDRPVWKNRILFYASIFASIALAFTIIFGLFKLIFHDFSILSNTAYTQYNTTQLNNMGFFDNERYLLSALVQSLAATIALVITLSLVAVQLAAQSYSARVIDVYKRNPDMWILLGIYIITIFYGLGLIKVVELGVSGINMEGAIFVAYFMGFFAFVCLVPYMLKTLDLLKPSTVIKLFAEEITKEKVLESLNNDGKIEDNDPVQPIIDMINGALERNDYETVRNGLTAIRKSTNLIIENTYFEKEEEERLVSHILLHVERFGIQAANKYNEDSALSVIHNLEKMENKAIEQKLQKASLKIVISIGKVGAKATEQKLQIGTNETAKTLENIGIKAIEEGLENISWKTVKAAECIGIKAANQKYENAVCITAKALENVGTKAADKEYASIPENTANALENIGIKAIEQELKSAADTTAVALQQIGLISIRKLLWKPAERAVDALQNIGIKAVEKDFESTFLMAATALGKIGVGAAGQEHERVTTCTENALNMLWTEAEEYLADDMSETFIKELDSIDKARGKSNL